MSQIEIYQWLGDHWVELAGSILGLIYIFLSVRQHILTWPVGLVSSCLYVYVFFFSKFYADMGLQVYYVVVSIYGWYFWLKGDKKQNKETADKEELPVSYTPRKYWLWLALIAVGLFIILAFVLKRYTDSPIPLGDSLTTALSIIATWMLARKYIEQWLLWVFIDALSAVFYAVKDLWPTVILFAVYTVMAVWGYIRWEKDLKIPRGEE